MNQSIASALEFLNISKNPRITAIDDTVIQDLVVREGGPKDPENRRIIVPKAETPAHQIMWKTETRESTISEEVSLWKSERTF